MIRKLLAIVVIAAIAGGFYWVRYHKADINNFADCVKNHGVLLLTYPEQCKAPGNNKTFTNPAQLLTH